MLEPDSYHARKYKRAPVSLTLKDAADYIMNLPKAEQNLAECRPRSVA